MRKFVVLVVALLLACPVMAADAPTTRQTTQPAPPLPFFFIGVWMQPAKDLKKWKDRGINVAITDKPKADNSSRASYFAAAAAGGGNVANYPRAARAANDLKEQRFL